MPRFTKSVNLKVFPIKRALQVEFRDKPRHVQQVNE
jgi:hypothetical protein